ncbi:hypothetical protein VA596_41385 [Amycolatopsis sp., V23-08]|uniref:Uncharacterized protein n=1 Tax=Amycolatopsis heterodermiae TaxID=3110235 RepID=A0ABU5RKI4_9PSEU|nr:hypothetical protein [Amycolatopsis sp., V23-08]MEA5366040.1 hypothetical protein [Amycolatopsis sp., V23-08]
MTAPSSAKTSPPTSAVVMFTLAALITLAAIPHVVLGVIDDWPPQPMTFHAAIAICCWLAGFHFKGPTRPAAVTPSESRPAWESGQQLRNLDNQLDDLVELDKLEKRLRDNDW